MTLQQLDNTIIATHLGKATGYKCQYDPSLLVREPRASNRVHLNIDDNNLPFVGQDTWNGYEFTSITDKGRPIVGVVKLAYPCDSKYIVESKSLKLYFNSFSMTKLGKSQDSVFAEAKRLAERDLSELLECSVQIQIQSNNYVLADNTPAQQEWMHGEYITLEDEYFSDMVDFNKYTEDPRLLKVIKNEIDYNTYHSALLRSRCRVTAQPDSGDVYISIKGDKTVDPISLLKYIVSFRDECHFHEEICETIYKRLYDLLQPEELIVRCLYARRGGWDINPERASNVNALHRTLNNIDVVHIKTPKQ